MSTITGPTPGRRQLQAAGLSPKAGEIPSGDRMRYAADEGQT